MPEILNPELLRIKTAVSFIKAAIQADLDIQSEPLVLLTVLHIEHMCISSHLFM